MVLIFCFSSQNGDLSSSNNYFVIELLNKLGIDLVRLLGSDFANFIIRKIAHVTEYFILFILFYNAFYKGRFKRSIIYSSILTVLYASSDEMHQMFVPGRGPMVRDVMIDTIGVAIGIIIILIIRKPFRKRITAEDKEETA